VRLRRRPGPFPQDDLTGRGRQVNQVVGPDHGSVLGASVSPITGDVRTITPLSDLFAKISPHTPWARQNIYLFFLSLTKSYAAPWDRGCLDLPLG
jgi:hypothetical protein